LKLLTCFFIYASYGPLSPEERKMALWLGGFGALAVLVLIVWLILMNLKYTARKQKVSKLIREFGKNDSFWNEEKMLVLGKLIFTSVQRAWWKSDFKEIGMFLTDGLKEEWIGTWVNFKKMNYVFHCRIIRIERVTVIAAEDYSDDTKDSFTLEISAELIRYLKIDRTKQLAPHNTANAKHVTDIYTFIRKDNQWLLDKINYSADLTEIFKYRPTNS
jgi:predicted lipid-binding transport protein (Tim44 family)